MKILEKETVGILEFQNRIVVPPMCNQVAEDGHVMVDHLITYGMYARNRPGMITVESTAIARNGRIFETDLLIDDDQYIVGLSKLAEVIQEHGAVACIQLGHSGAKHYDLEKAIAPSAIGGVVSEMDRTEIIEIGRNFVDAAIRAKAAGFDAIEIHSAHGYLLHQFLSPLTNKRKDGFGGSLENRFKLLKNIILNIQNNVEIEIFVRISAVDFHPNGLQINDTIVVSQWLEELGVNLINVSSGGISSLVDVAGGEQPCEKVEVYPCYMVQYANAIKQELLFAKVATVGDITEVYQMEQIVSSNQADFVCVGRKTLLNPLWLLNVQLEAKNQDLCEPYKRFLK
ncbi:MAG: hypothetical protein ACRCUP_01895 [Mycoplasmatales bacterium]